MHPTQRQDHLAAKLINDKEQPAMVNPQYSGVWPQQPRVYGQSPYYDPNTDAVQRLLRIIEKPHEPKVNVSLFAGSLDPEIYLDWLNQLEKQLV